MLRHPLFRSACNSNAKELLRRAFSTSEKQQFEFLRPFKLHRKSCYILSRNDLFLTHLAMLGLEKGPENHAYSSKEELLEYYRLMYTMRRMEITCDNEYKVCFDAFLAWKAQIDVSIGSNHPWFLPSVRWSRSCRNRS